MTAKDPVVQALRQQLQQLEAEHAAGALGEQDYAARRAAIERHIVAAVAPPPAAEDHAAAPPAGGGSGMRWLAGIAGGAALLVGLAYWRSEPVEPAAAPEAAAGTPAPAAQAPHAMGKEEMAAMTDRLAARLQKQPDDVEGWVMLGRSYLVIGKPDAAVTAYERALKLRPTDAALMADYADALAMAKGRSLEGEPAKWIAKALQADPDNLKALALAGTEAFNRGDYARAVGHWDRAVKIGPPEHPLVRQSREGAAAARERGKLPAATTTK